MVQPFLSTDSAQKGVASKSGISSSSRECKLLAASVPEPWRYRGGRKGNQGRCRGTGVTLQRVPRAHQLQGLVKVRAQVLNGSLGPGKVHSLQRTRQMSSLRVSKQQILLPPDTNPPTPTNLTSLERAPEGTGHLLVTGNLESALSQGCNSAEEGLIQSRT